MSNWSMTKDMFLTSWCLLICRGYMAPEYLANGQLTEKADVYSFGVLLLEIVTGRQNNKGKTSEFSDSLVTVVSWLLSCLCIFYKLPPKGFNLWCYFPNKTGMEAFSTRKHWRDSWPKPNAAWLPSNRCKGRSSKSSTYRTTMHPRGCITKTFNVESTTNAGKEKWSPSSTN